MDSRDAWLNLLNRARAAGKTSSEATLRDLREATIRVEALPPSNQARLAGLVHHALLKESGNDGPRRALRWPAVLRANAACVRAGYRSPDTTIASGCAMRIMLSTQASFANQILPERFDHDGRVQFFWSAVASDKALADYWSAERRARSQSDTPGDHAFANLVASQALACISTNHASAERIAAMNVLVAGDDTLLGPFSRLYRYPIASTERWLYEGWPADLSPLAADLARLAPALLLDLICLARKQPRHLEIYLCPSTRISILDCLSSIAKPCIIETHHEALLAALAQASHRDDVPPDLFAILESASLKREIGGEILASNSQRKAIRL